MSVVLSWCRRHQSKPAIQLLHALPIALLLLSCSAAAAEVERQVLICGSGNAAHALASLIGSRPNYRCVVLTTKAERWEKVLNEKGGVEMQTPSGETTIGRPHLITSIPEKAVPGSDVIILSVPSTAHEVYLKAIRSHLQPDRRVIMGTMPCGAGFDWNVRHILGDKMDQVDLFGAITLPWACRIEQWGHRVSILGTKREVEMIVRPKENSAKVVSVLQDIFGESPRFQIDLSVSFLSPSLFLFWHPTIMYSQFKDWDGKTPFASEPLFYTGISDEGADLVLRVDAEVQAIRRNLEEKYHDLNLAYTRPSQEWLERAYNGSITDKSSFGAMLRSNKAYQGLKHPMKNSTDGFLPDFENRYMTEGLANGIVVIKGIAELAGVPTPELDKVIEWCQRMTSQEFLIDGKLVGKDVVNSRSPQKYNLTTIGELVTVNL